MADTEFYRTLQSLGLEQYHAALTAEAFDSWPVLSRITEQDMNTLGIRLGHRRILQDAIAAKLPGGLQRPQHQPMPAVELAPQLSMALPQLHTQTSEPTRPGQRAKRKYVRHPKIDENAPPRPPTGYVMFSNWVRDGLRGEQYDFPDIAKLVGRKWQAASQSEKDYFLNEAKKRKAVYLQDMTKYKRTAKYREYQRYLLEFKIRNGNLPPARAHGRLRNGEDSMDDEIGTPPSDGLSGGITSDVSDYGSTSTEMRSTSFRQDTSNESEQSRSPPSVIRSPNAREPIMSNLAYSITSRPSSGPRSPSAQSPRENLANRLPSLSGIQTRQLPPLNMPPIRN